MVVVHDYYHYYFHYCYCHYHYYCYCYLNFVQFEYHFDVHFQLLCILIFSNFAYKKCCDLFFTFGFLWKVFVTFFYIGLMNNWLKLFLKGLQCIGWFSGQNLRKQFLLKRQGLLKRYLGLEKRNSQRRCRENVLEHAVGVIRYLNWHLPE